MKKKIKKSLSLLLAVVLLLTAAPLASPEAKAAESYLTAQSDDWNNLEDILTSFDMGNITTYNAFNFNDDIQVAYDGYVFTKNNVTLSKYVTSAFLNNPYLIFSSQLKKYLGDYIYIDYNEDLYDRDPLKNFGEYSGYYKIPSRNLDWIFENVFNVTATHESDYEYMYYYYNEYYYLSEFFESCVVLSVDITNRSLNSNGSYDVEYLMKETDETGTITAGRVIVNVCLRNVDGKRIWRINSIKRVKTISDAYKEIIWKGDWGDDYCIYDIDKDGTTELITENLANGEAGRIYKIYTYDGNSAIKIGETSGYHSSIMGINGRNGFYLSIWYPFKGDRSLDKVTIEEGCLKRINVIPYDTQKYISIPDDAEKMSWYKHYDDLGLNLAKYTEVSPFTATHYSYAKTRKLDSAVLNNGFYNNVWQNESGWRIGLVGLWDFLGDVGEVASFKFDDLMIEKDYYELFLYDLVLKYFEKTKADELEIKSMDVFNKTYSILKKTMNSSDDWKEALKLDPKAELEVKGFLFDPKYKMKDSTKAAFEKVLESSFADNYKDWEDALGSVSKASQIFDYVSSGIDIANAFVEANNAYIISDLFKQLSDELFEICYAASERMYATSPKFAEWFKKAVDKTMKKMVDTDETLRTALKLTHEIGLVAYDLTLKEVLQKVTYNSIANCMGVPVHYIFAPIFAYNATYQILDFLLPLGKQKTPYYFMHFVSHFEKALGSVSLELEGNLLNQATYTNAYKYDVAVNMLTATNAYLYNCFCDFVMANVAPIYNLNSYFDNIAFCVKLKAFWEQGVKCHNPVSSTSKTISVKCPVDVFVYNEKGTLVASVENELITYSDNSITILNSNGNKSFAWPSYESYSVKIKAREAGKMQYSVSELTDYETTRDVEFRDISLAENQEFYGKVPSENNVANSEYELTTGGSKISCDYDSLNSEIICDGIHNFAESGVERNADCTSVGIRYQECVVCGFRNKDYIPAFGHTDQNNDGKCDRCGESMGTQQPDQPENPSSNCSCACHKKGLAKFFFKIGLIFQKIFKKNKICKCGVWHY